MRAFVLFLFCVSLTPMVKAQMDTMKSINYPYEVKYAELETGLRLAYMEEGTGKQTLVLIHGLGSYAPAWWRLMEELKSDFRCIALDLPGYGKSDTSKAPYSMAYFATTLAQFIQHLNIEQPVVVGHSMGGQVAMTLALQAPALLSELILIAPAGFETFTEQDQLFFRQFFTPEAVAATPPDRIRLNFAVNFHQMQFPENALFMYEDRMTLRTDTAAYQAYCRMIPQCVQAMLKEPVFALLPTIKLPTQVVFGKGDLLIPNTVLHPDLSVEQVATAGVERLPNAKLDLLEACGHFVQWECAEAVAKIIRNRLN